jgi:ribulose bisphosphate carboxylase small subunit
MNPEEREPIEITTSTKGAIVLAKSTRSDFEDWIILIEYVTETNDYGAFRNDLMIYTHVSWKVGADLDDANVGKNKNWGVVKGFGYKFYKATEEEKNIIKKILKSHDKKYIRIINKLIDR